MLIRTYNDSVIEIVSEIDQQCQQLDLNYEILISDDDPSGKNVNEQKLKHFETVSYWKNTSNLGRSNNLNKLIDAAKFDYVLCLDNDVIPLRTDFIRNYKQSIDEGCDVVYGGLTYDDNLPEESKRLRWIYGHQKEAKSIKIRKKELQYHVLVSNLLLRKSAFSFPIFDPELTSYGYEDLIFSEELKKKRLMVCQIDNPVIHKGLETSKVFIEKTELALKNLRQLIQKNKVSNQSTPLTRLYYKMKSNISLQLFLASFAPFKNIIKNHLLSKQPRMFWFDIYKLYYFAKYTSKK